MKSFVVDVVSERNGEEAFHLLLGVLSLHSWHVLINKNKNYGYRWRPCDERLGNHPPRATRLNQLTTLEQQSIQDFLVLGPHNGHAWTQCKEFFHSALDLIIILPACLFSVLPCREAIEMERTGNWWSQIYIFSSWTIDIPPFFLPGQVDSRTLETFLFI